MRKTERLYGKKNGFKLNSQKRKVRPELTQLPWSKARKLKNKLRDTRERLHHKKRQKIKMRFKKLSISTGILSLLPR